MNGRKGEIEQVSEDSCVGANPVLDPANVIILPQ